MKTIIIFLKALINKDFDLPYSDECAEEVIRNNYCIYDSMEEYNWWIHM
ncbi:hypothetical protein CCP3SC1AL1_4750002 [Gammaproteobacteria bacterium]